MLIQYFISIMTTSIQGNDEYILTMKTVTWQKDSHSLFDYEFNKNVIQNTIDFPLINKYIYIYRNNQSKYETMKTLKQVFNNNKVYYIEQIQSYSSQEHKKHKLQFYNAEQLRVSDNINQNAPPPFPSEFKEEDIYLIVRSLKTKNNQNKGYKLAPGQIIKLGRVQYLISSINNSGNFNKESKSKFWTNTKKINVGELPTENTGQILQCKYCMLGEGTQLGQFLCTPCKCSGTCGLVHFKCLQRWNQSKVKKQVVGGTIQYNFEKFYCEVCKDQYPRYIEKNGQQFQLMPIEKPTGPHLMLQGVSEKANNMMVIQNISPQGIKLGRGHECEIRITDISVSRNHAKIEKNGDDYIIFDNKSKFGTLVKEQRLSIELSRIKQGVQIGRTVITFEKSKKI